MAAVEQQFDKLFQDCISAARSVQCSPAEYREALEQAIEDLRMEILASEELEARP